MPHPQKPAAVKAPKLQFEVITAITIGQLDAQVAEGTMSPYVYFALSEPDYLNLASWLQDMLRYINEQNEIAKYYREHPLLNPPKPSDKKLLQD